LSRALLALALKTSETRFITPIRAAVPFIYIHAADVAARPGRGGRAPG
jgi:hypothetical protein